MKRIGGIPIPMILWFLVAYIGGSILVIIAKWWGIVFMLVCMGFMFWEGAKEKRRNQ